MKIPRFYGYAILSLFVYVLLFSTVWNLWSVQWQFLTIFSLFALGCLYVVYTIFDKEVYRQSMTLDFKKSLMDWSMVFTGALITYVIHVHIDALGPVMAAGMVGMLAALFIKPHQVAIYCGSFIGMSSPLLLGMWPFLVASAIAGIVFVLAKDVYNGFGGKLGTIALSGALIISVMTGRIFLPGPSFDLSQQLMIIGFSVFAAVVTYTYSIRLKQGPVLASAMVGFLGGAILPFAMPVFGPTLGVVVIGASFVGMSSPARFKHEGPMAMAGVLFGLIFIYSAPYFGGAGGKLGTIAFVSVLSIRGVQMFIDHIRPTQSEC